MSDELRETTVVKALLRPPTFFGAPRWVLTVELAVVMGMWFGAGVVPASFVLTAVVFGLVHPVVALKCRPNPYAVDMFIAYVRRPVVYSNREMAGARSLSPIRTR